jgi:hypothetical protein
LSGFIGPQRPDECIHGYDTRRIAAAISRPADSLARATLATSKERMAAHRERKKTRQLRLSLTIGGEDADEMIQCGYDVRAADPAAAVAAAERSSATPLPASTPRGGDSVTQR